MATAPHPPHILLVTGASGVGKTTVLRKVAESLDVRICGFYTEELREDGRAGYPFHPREHRLE